MLSNVKRLLPLILLLNLFSLSPSNAAELPSEMEYQNTKLILNGHGTRIRFFMKAYEGSLYLESPSNNAEKIINEDVDIDINFAGKFIGDIDQIYFNSKSEILYHPPKIMEVLFNNKGEEIKKQDPKEIISNVRDDSPPIKWTGKFFKREEVLKKFVINKSIQLRHIDGLTYEFLFEMAKTLDDQKSLILLGGGSTGKDPLIFQSNGSPYRGFLDGRIKGKEYKLILRLSNLELRGI